MKIFCALLLMFLPSCAIDITVTKTEGHATDVVDNTAEQAATADVKPNIDIPIKPL